MAAGGGADGALHSKCREEECKEARVGVGQGRLEVADEVVAEETEVQGLQVLRPQVFVFVF